MKAPWLLVMLASVAGAPAAGELDELLQEVQTTRARESREDQERVSRFLADRDQQQKRLSETRAALAKAEADSKALRAEFAANQTRVAELNAELKKQSADLSELFGRVREFAGKLKADLETSLVSAQFPGRPETLAPLVGGRALPAVGDLENLWVAALQEMAESGRTVVFPGKVTDAAGEERPLDVYRIGNFSALADGHYLRYVPESGRLAVVTPPPDSEFLSLAKRLPDARDRPVRVAVDPSRGGVLDAAAHAPEALPWVPKPLRGLLGNAVDVGVFAVLLLASIWALAVAFERWFYYRRVDVGQFDHRTRLETDLTRNLTVIGTVAANAPFVGLLGTVLGVMMTFHRMGLEKGSMDVHSIMLGLSTALKATAIGLLVAIPCVILNNLLRRRVRELLTDFEVRHGS